MSNRSRPARDIQIAILAGFAAVVAAPAGHAADLIFTAVESPETAFQAIVGYFGWPIVILALVLFASLLWGLLGAVLHIFDRALDRSIQEAWPDEYLNVCIPAVEAPSSSIDPYNVLQSELSAADLREQTKLLCALRDKLDADAESARATIRRERALAHQTQTGKDTP